MTSALDPRVSAALGELVPVPDADVEDLLRGARRRARSHVRRRWAFRALVAGALLAAGTAVAAPSDLAAWLRSGDEAVARFSIDPSKRYHGPSPASISCQPAGDGRLDCTPVDGRGEYELSGSAYAVPYISRESLLDVIDENEEHGALPRWKARQMRADAAAVSDEFYEKVNILETVRAAQAASDYRRQGGTAAHAAPRSEMPPLIGCDSGTARRLSCRELAGAEALPAGAPVYSLTSTRTPPSRANDTYGGTYNAGGLIRAVFGRQLSEQERRLLLSISLLAYAEGY